METLIPLITLPAIAGLGFLTRKTGYIGEEAFSHLPQLMLRLCYPPVSYTHLYSPVQTPPTASRKSSSTSRYPSPY